MSDEIAKRNGREIAQRNAAGGLTPAQIAEFVDKPLRQLPAEWRVHVWDFWAFWSHLFPNQLPIATRLRHWIDDGLTLDDARKIFDKLTRASRASEIEFPGTLLSALAAEVEAVFGRIRMREQMRRRQEEYSQYRHSGPYLADLHRMSEQAQQKDQKPPEEPPE